LGIIQLLTDDGDPSRNNRSNVFQEDFKVVGLSVGPHKSLKSTATVVLAGGFEAN